MYILVLLLSLPLLYPFSQTQLPTIYKKSIASASRAAAASAFRTSPYPARKGLPFSVTGLVGPRAANLTGAL